ncbi:zinc finger protein 675-like isoform X1 [Aphis gossypii]|uniref:zinc finger protein 675-like isoform X1 n=1 Tax=Aphis gossypii TaxID=80765 RepID=UPI00215909FF|nr:zinc finger protein 675-like isoform X1 [Aphis gossypii]XP_050063607.1 zinc finger protein 675-like isoform X1 [Aphis gossypii]XP_050063608.1 zinc finger protein 675-like isoform X1 [Aphis gossypii]XP_050063609.1 zinc finger protein 675-like isoform X1 [Aphis gossypii]XP_050063610.1 zinc finger protein 675-like isoform X1 [Aphis gossypii]XP_050063612.1 zinc finger protein 675-like isoform X1 [Aphis gossypii]
MSEIPQIKCEPQDIILNKYIKQEPIDGPIEFDHDNDHDIPPNNQCSTKYSEFSTDKGKDEIKLEVDEIDGIRYESICVAENHELPPMTPSMKNSTKSYNKKKTTKAPKIVHNTDTPLKSCSTKDSKLSTDKGKDEIKLEVDEIDGIRYESICVAENHELPPMTPSMKNSTKSYNKKKTTKAPKIVHNTNAPFKFRSTKYSEFSTDKGKDEIKLEVDEIDGIRYESICVTENHVLPPMTSSMKNSTKSHNNKNSIKAPKIVYNINRPFKCDTCNKRFIRKEHLKTHIFIHTGIRPYKCETCDKSYTRKDNFKSHQMIHSGEKPFKCGVCNKSFLHKGHIRSHIRIHTGERPYKCNVCGKSFLQKGHLKTHKQIHSGERPYKCHRCDLSYTRKDILESHKKIHLGEKPFICDICKKNFLLKSQVRAHMRTHTGEKPFKCVYCNKTFSRKDNMKAHIARLHTK